jgi:maleylpyruvate isomerase
MRLHDYWRSSAAYRVRIALNLKGIAYEPVAVNLRQGAHRTLDYLARNPQGLVPTLDAGELVLTQSLAAIEYLDETHPDPPLLPKDRAARAEVRSLALHVACEIHPLNNLRVLQHLKQRLGLEEAEVNAWYRHWINEGFASLEARLKRGAGRYCHGDAVTLADVCLVPQVYNARRYNCDLGPFATVRRVEAARLELSAFERARPEQQPDAS